MTTSEALSAAIADSLADPDARPLVLEDRQHLAYGMPGIALLHIERAAAGLAPWSRAHDWLFSAARQPVTSGPDSHPFYGAPALAHAVACAADHQPGSYERALTKLDEQMVRDVRRRLSAAHRRLDAGQLPQFAEFDVIRGLTGYGSYLLRRQPAGGALRDVLDYCVRLTRPITDRGERLPGWWAPTAPMGRLDDQFPEGHANHGMSHGVGGVLALLALAARHGTVVDGQHDAMRTILAWLSRWHGQAWPYWVTRAELRADSLAPSAPRRPSWCYGTAGVARAQQLAALALNEAPRQVEAETALVAALTDPAQLRATTDNGLCHGFAGLAHVASRAADDAHPSTAAQLRDAIPALLSTVCPPDTDPVDAAVANEAGPGFLDGAAGIALAVLAPATGTPPHTAWDSCLLIA
ncbi:lanthionine synthetase C family protein [Streptomyces bathyalis]|uniref:Lanthionine synthetase C family protein n=1 Tax=Streptomyces bathyalis TaxID=2710756 RepID=A0A7T1WQG3_9ACTN|nr:lanthionine synthetase C family protein [Streptomyces bathyalis]QPP05126.1 lanthionine synthetase C family protein [Streptomyces bathyalis]